jgi:hypothetical protein
MIKFNDDEVAIIEEIARIEMNRCPQLRFGQSVWNAAHDFRPETMDSLRSTKSDFFYIKSDSIAWKIFIENYTVKGEHSNGQSS